MLDFFNGKQIERASFFEKDAMRHLAETARPSRTDLIKKFLLKQSDGNHNYFYTGMDGKELRNSNGHIRNLVRGDPNFILFEDNYKGQNRLNLITKNTVNDVNTFENFVKSNYKIEKNIDIYSNYSSIRLLFDSSGAQDEYSFAYSLAERSDLLVKGYEGVVDAGSFSQIPRQGLRYTLENLLGRIRSKVGVRRYRRFEFFQREDGLYRHTEDISVSVKFARRGGKGHRAFRGLVDDSEILLF
ncbi:hypothetical protein [Brucella sp. LJL56]